MKSMPEGRVGGPDDRLVGYPCRAIQAARFLTRRDEGATMDWSDAVSRSAGERQPTQMCCLFQRGLDMLRRLSGRVAE